MTTKGEPITLEREIEHGRETFVRVGQALMEIRDQRLYRPSYRTFDSYCRERWGMSRVHVYRMIEAARVAAVGAIPRERVSCDEAQLEVWRKAHEEAVQTNGQPQSHQRGCADDAAPNPEADTICPACGGSGRVKVKDVGGRLR